jgi:uncharacterized protein
VGAVSVSLDVNVIVALFAIDPLNDKSERALRGLRDTLVVSDLAAAEFSAVISRRVRARDLRSSEAQTAFANFDMWCARHAEFVEIGTSDVSGATALLRRLDLSLRTPDALHIAIAQRIGSALLTFDRTMANIARAVGVDVVAA